MRNAALALAAVLAMAAPLALAPTARADAAVDWNALADVRTIELVTVDPDGRPRETPVWLAVVDGQGYVRTTRSRWLANLERDPDLLVRVNGAEHPLRAVGVSDARTREAVIAAFRAKYGFTDALLEVVRGLLGTPTVLRLEPRTSVAPVR